MRISENGGRVDDEDGNVTYYEGTVENITDRKRVEEALYREIEEQKRIEKELEEAKEAAEAANLTRNLFLSNMSHELRTPLNAIIGYSEILQEDMTELGYQKSVPDLKRIQMAGKHLLEMINSILDLSKIEAGKMDLFLENFDLAEMINEVQETSQPLAAKNENPLTVTMYPNLALI